MRPRLFDCFTFFDEFDLLEIRLREIGSLVDRFVLVEASSTFQGERKPLYFQQQRARFKAWEDKIDHVVVDFPEAIPHASAKKKSTWGAARSLAWDREFYQRNQIARGLATAAPDDVVMVSDVDEIPRRSVLSDVMEKGLYRGNLVILLMPYYRFFLNCRVNPPRASAQGEAVGEMSVVGYEFGSDPADDLWNGPHLVQKRHLTTPSKLRRARGDVSNFWHKAHLDGLGIRLRNWRLSGITRPVVMLRDAGWHFSSLGGYEGWLKKVRAFSHVEYRNTVEFRDEAAFKKWLDNHKIVETSELPACVTADLPSWEKFLYRPA